MLRREGVNSLYFSSVAQSCPTLCNPMNGSTPGLPVHHQLPEFTQTHVHQVGDAIQPSHPLSSPSPPALNLSQHQGKIDFSNESALRIRWPKYWSFSFSISPSSEHPGLISFRMDWLDFIEEGGFELSFPRPGWQDHPEKHFKNPLRNAILLHTLEWFRINISTPQAVPVEATTSSQSTVQVLAFSVEGRERRLWCHGQLIFPCVEAAHLLCCRRAQTF